MAWVFASFGLFNLALRSKWWRLFMKHTLCGWLFILFNYYRRRSPDDLHTNLSGYVFLFWRGVLKASKALSFGSKIEVANGCSTRFWLEYWVDNDILVSTFPSLSQLAMDLSSLASTQTYLLDGRRFWALNFEDGHFKISPMITTTFLPYFNRRTSTPPPRMFGNGSLNMVFHRQLPL